MIISFRVVFHATQVDGDVNGKDWSRRMGDLFKMVLDLALLNMAPLSHCSARGCSQLARLEAVWTRRACVHSLMISRHRCGPWRTGEEL